MSFSSRPTGLFVCLLFLLTTFSAAANAQFGQPSGSGPGFPGGGVPGGGDGNVGGAAPGGAAQADFQTLMNLIQQTIDPDSWLANGGTSTILPYPAGVYVDPAGVMKRVETGSQVNFPMSSTPRHGWKTPSGVRTVSLRQLDQALRRSLELGLSPSLEMQRLAGLSRIEYVRLDYVNEDILIAGPAAAGQSIPGFQLQDVALLATLIRNGTEPMGCSIEPTDTGLRAAQKYLQGSGISKQLARNPQMVVEQMQAKIGPHQVKVFGMPANTGTAVALVDADEHMKRVGFGEVDLETPVSDYFDHLAKENKVPAQSMIRWWFSYTDQAILANADKTVFQLPKNCTAVLSEQQWITQQGRAPTGGHDKSADAFAAGMTEKLDELRTTHPSYARLSAVFELGLALQLAIEHSGQPNLEAWLPTLCSVGSNIPERNVRPRAVEGLTTWRKLPSGTVVAVVSGGVKMDLATTVKEQLETDELLASSLVPQQPEQLPTSHGTWWWDGR